jgi:hypothetical protein
MRFMLVFFIAWCTIAAIPTSTAVLPAAVGQAAPDFNLKDSDGKSYSLSGYKGKYVVLEWVNFDCPFVRAQYHSGVMPDLQKAYTERGVVWLSVCSSSQGKDGFFEGSDLKARMEALKAAPSAYLVDAGGNVGRLYAVKSTPTMYIVNPQGIVIYAGGIDDTPTTNPDEVSYSRNYVREALDLAMEGKPVKVTYSKSYGCSVKY